MTGYKNNDETIDLDLEADWNEISNGLKKDLGPANSFAMDTPHSPRQN